MSKPFEDVFNDILKLRRTPWRVRFRKALIRGEGDALVVLRLGRELLIEVQMGDDGFAIMEYEMRSGHPIKEIASYPYERARGCALRLLRILRQREAEKRRFA